MQCLDVMVLKLGKEEARNDTASKAAQPEVQTTKNCWFDCSKRVKKYNRILEK